MAAGKFVEKKILARLCGWLQLKLSFAKILMFHSDALYEDSVVESQM